MCHAASGVCNNLLTCPPGDENNFVPKLLGGRKAGACEAHLWHTISVSRNLEHSTLQMVAGQRGKLASAHSAARICRQILAEQLTHFIRNSISSFALQ
jgi:hypothetical protein